MKCLRDFIRENTLSESKDGGVTNSDSHPNVQFLDQALEYALLNLFVVPNLRYLQPPHVQGAEHAHVVDQCIAFLVRSNQFNNVLTFGYKIAKNPEVISSLHCEFSNFNVTKVKSGLWKTIRSIIGTERFVDLLVNYSIYEHTNYRYTQVVGPLPKEHRHNFSSNVGLPNGEITFVENSGFLYCNNGQCRPHYILPHSSQTLACQILGDLMEDGSISDSLRPRPLFWQTIHQVIKNHQSLKYKYIFDAFCSVDSLAIGTANGKQDTDVKSVVRFLTVIMEKTFPLRFFGSKRNMHKILSRVILLTKLKLGGRLPLAILSKGLKIKDICWLTALSKSSITKSDLSQEVLQRLLAWIFGRYIPSLIKTFFYCCEYSSTTEIVFFRFDVWNRMSQPYLTAYFKNNLILNKSCGDHSTNKVFTHGCLRLIPKKSRADFRVIFIPLKWNEPEKLAGSWDYLRNVIKPSISILKYVSRKRETFTSRLSSPLDIPSYLLKFKKRVLDRYGVLPEMYFIKFDIESCYDSIPTPKAMEVIEEQLQDYSEFFVRYYSYLDPEKKTFKQVAVVNDDMPPHRNGITIDNVRTIHLTKQDVVAALDREFKQNAIIHAGRCYLRKRGIFQGTSLSAAVVDSFYDDLVQKSEEFLAREDSESLVLRLADDFLVVSTDEFHIRSLNLVVSGGFREYGAFSNKKKVRLYCPSLDDSSEDRSVRFCAMDLNIQKLEIMKHSDTMNVLAMSCNSTRLMFRRLESLFKTRLSYGLTERKLNSWNTILLQIEHACVNIVQSMIQSFCGESISIDGFLGFTEALIRLALQSCHISSANYIAVIQVRRCVYLVFLGFLKNGKVKLRNMSNTIRVVEHVIEVCTSTIQIKAGEV